MGVRWRGQGKGAAAAIGERHCLECKLVRDRGMTRNVGQGDAIISAAAGLSHQEKQIQGPERDC
jgi:hypothetical protein